MDNPFMTNSFIKPVTQDDEEILHYLTEAVLSDEGITITGIKHSKRDVMEAVWDNADDAEELEKAIFSIADAAGNPSQCESALTQQSRIINRAAEEYARKLLPDFCSEQKRQRIIQRANFS